MVFSGRCVRKELVPMSTIIVYDITQHALVEFVTRADDSAMHVIEKASHTHAMMPPYSSFNPYANSFPLAP